MTSRRCSCASRWSRTRNPIRWRVRGRTWLDTITTLALPEHRASGLPFFRLVTSPHLDQTLQRLDGYRCCGYGTHVIGVIFLDRRIVRITSGHRSYWNVITDQSSFVPRFREMSCDARYGEELSTLMISVVMMVVKAIRGSIFSCCSPSESLTD